MRSGLTALEELELLELLELEDRERVSPIIERARTFQGMIIGARGGRGAGGKSTGFAKLLVQQSQYEPHRVACLREIQNSLEESVYALVQELVDEMRYPGWHFTREYAESKCGAKWIFRGLKDMRSTTNIKGLQGFTRFFVEEASTISSESWDILLPTLFRNEGAQLWFCYNPESETDPVTKKIWNPYQGNQDALLLECRPGKLDNPWFNEAMQKLSDDLKTKDSDLWDHVYGGQPRRQGDKAILPRGLVRQAMSRKLPDSKVQEQFGIDVARFGDDKTTIWHRRGMRVLAWRELHHKDTQEVARIAWDMAKQDHSIPFAVDDTGVGGGVSDKLKDLGAKVRMINFGGAPGDKSKYTTVADEMWFEFPIEEVELPDDDLLFEELTQRRFDYTSDDRKKIEAKKDFKARLGRSPDRADGLLLAFYQGRSSANLMTDDQRAQMAARRRG